LRKWNIGRSGSKNEAIRMSQMKIEVFIVLLLK
jgi:hypothetical protein